MVDSKTLHSVLWVQILPFPLVSYKRYLVRSKSGCGAQHGFLLVSGYPVLDGLTACFHKILRGFVSWPIDDFNNFLYIRKHAAPCHLGKVT